MMFDGTHLIPGDQAMIKEIWKEGLMVCDSERIWNFYVNM